MQLTLPALFDRIETVTGNLYGTVKNKPDAINNK